MLFVILGIVGGSLFVWGMKKDKGISAIVGGVLLFAGVIFTCWCPWATNWKEITSEEIFPMGFSTNEALPIYVIEGDDFLVYRISKTLDFERPYAKLQRIEDVEYIEETRDKYIVKKYTTASDWLISFDLSSQVKHVFYIPEDSILR